VEIQEINLRSGKTLPDRQPPPPEDEEDKQESEPKAIPPFPERLPPPHNQTQRKMSFWESSNNCV